MKQNELLGHIVIAVCEATKSPTSLIFGTRVPDRARLLQPVVLGNWSCVKP